MTNHPPPYLSMPYTPPADPGDARCRNCGAPLTGEFCAECGQQVRDLDLSLRAMLGDFFGSLFNFDSRVWRTVSLLLTRPGALTARYLDGQRARFVPPVRLYIFVSLVYFLFLAFTTGGPQFGTEPVMQGGDPMVTEAGDTVTVAEFLRREWSDDDRDVPWIADLAAGAWERVQADPRGFWRTFLQGLSYLMFVLLPLFAGLLKTVYWRRRRFFLHHLVFATHFHVFVFMILGAKGVLSLPGVAPLSALSDLLTWTVPLYLFVALRRVYGGQLWTTVLRTVGLIAAYLALVIAAALTLLAVLLLV
jgi:hypothetical protein